jgi:hypothetical protein
VKQQQEQLKDLKNNYDVIIARQASPEAEPNANPNEPDDKAYVKSYQAIHNNIKYLEQQLVEEIKLRVRLKEEIKRKETRKPRKSFKEDLTDFKPLTNAELDDAVIDKCHFIWKPFNFHDKNLQRRIDRRMVRQTNTNPLVFNHFECLKDIGTKSGLIRSLKQYYYTN